MERLYYVEKIIQENNDKCSAVLQYIPSDISMWDKGMDLKHYIKIPIKKTQIEKIEEGKYVFMNGSHEFRLADNDSRVKAITERYDRLIHILSMAITQTNMPIYKNIEKLYSYHVNVGHGNHSLLVFEIGKEADKEVHVWMVDCSDYDYLLHRYYRNNIDKCLDHIRKKFHKQSLKIEVVMLTHPHYDHYSGISYYIDDKLIDRETIFYINRHYNIKSPNFTNLLSRIDALQSRIIEPFICNSSDNIHILYPDSKKFEEHKLTPNNMSSVYSICFDDRHYFLFPGDLEIKGWELMDTQKFDPNIMQIWHYAISHHGSENGHFLKVVSPNCTCPFFCLVLMGRDGAYHDIYSQYVIDDFKKHFCDDILYSEKDNKGNKNVSFLEINLMEVEWEKKAKWYN